MSDINDFPLIQFRPTPSDAELEAERDAQHANEVVEYWRRMHLHDGHDDWPITEVIG